MTGSLILHFDEKMINCEQRIGMLEKQGYFQLSDAETSDEVIEKATEKVLRVAEEIVPLPLGKEISRDKVPLSIKSTIREERGDMNFWEKVKGDLQKGVEESITFVKEGASVVRKKAEELTEEGKRRYRIYELKTSVQKEISELGGKVYELSGKLRNPMLDSKVKSIKARIKKLETEIMRLEGNLKPESEKPRTRKKSLKKEAGKKATRAQVE